MPLIPTDSSKPNMYPRSSRKLHKLWKLVAKYERLNKSGKVLKLYDKIDQINAAMDKRS